MQSHDDNEPFKPHADVHEDREDPNHDDVPTEPADPEKLRCDYIATDHPPVTPAVRSERAVHESELFEWVAAIPGDKEFHGIGVADNCACRQSDLAHQVDVP